MALPDVRDDDLTALRAVLSRFPGVHEAWVFGSRATGAAHRASDLDIAVQAPEMSSVQWSEVVEALEESRVIYPLDIVRLDGSVPDALRARIEREGIRIWPVAT